MAIKVTCPTGHVLHVDDKHAGRSGKCPYCQALVHVPKPGELREEEILAIVEPPPASRPSPAPAKQPDGPALAAAGAGKETDEGRPDSAPLAGHPPSSVYHHLGVWRSGDKTAVRFGDHRILDELAVKKIGDELVAVAGAPKCRHLVVNFAGVQGITTLMLGKLLMLNKMMAAKGGRMILCEIDPDIENVFTETKLTQILKIVETEADALKACV
jgi:anti-anti-sigma factor